MEGYSPNSVSVVDGAFRRSAPARSWNHISINLFTAHFIYQSPIIAYRVVTDGEIVYHLDQTDYRFRK